MCPIRILPAQALRRRCNPKSLPKSVTDTESRNDAISGFVGQERAVEAVRFGLSVRHHGYNIFAAGPHGVGKRTILEQLLRRKSSLEPPPEEWCYVHDFSGSGRPRALRLPHGKGVELANAMSKMVERLVSGLQAAFESQKYRSSLQRLESELERHQQREFEKLERHAAERNVGITSTDGDFVVVPLGPTGPLSPEQIQVLSPEEQEQLDSETEQVRQELRDMLEGFHSLGQEHRESRRKLDRQTAATVAGRVVGLVKIQHHERPRVLAHLADVETDIISSAAKLADVEAEEGAAARLLEHFDVTPLDAPHLSRRYLVNLLVDADETNGPPVVFVDNPTGVNLVGRIEQRSLLGNESPDFSMIVAGALHRARGGYLVLDAEEVLESSFAWRTLKRALKSGQIQMDPLDESDHSTASPALRPEPIPLGSTKVILLGEPHIYYQLAAADPDFLELFKILTEFDDRTEWNTETEHEYAHVVDTLAAREGLKPLERRAIAKVIEFAARLASDSQKLSLRLRTVVDLLIEADVWSSWADSAIVTAEHVHQALNARMLRRGKERQRVLDSLRRGTVFIDTEGHRVGQINGLVVASMGEASFGHAMRISARVRVGRGDLVDIEREVELGGPLHSKGVLLLSGYLGSRYAHGFPLALSASIGLEQSYVPIEGDSATLAEACAVLSALGDAPIHQSWAVTGSMNQAGEVQAIGGVNEKIEGFFDLCCARGLSGVQGVLIPESNATHLMLRQDVVDAVESGKFQIATVQTVDDALELLTDRTAGECLDSGEFPTDTLNADIRSRLALFAEQARHFAPIPPSRVEPPFSAP